MSLHLQDSLTPVPAPAVRKGNGVEEGEKEDGDSEEKRKDSALRGRSWCGRERRGLPTTHPEDWR